MERLISFAFTQVFYLLFRVSKDVIVSWGVLASTWPDFLIKVAAI
jgi:hypothetical protein